MSNIVTDCPRCGAKKITFDVIAQIYKKGLYDWDHSYEIFCNCRSCYQPTIFVVSRKDGRSSNPEDLVHYQGGLNGQFRVVRFVSIKDNITIKPPDYLPENINSAFLEGATCLSIGCYNAAGAMFRLCVDLVTKPLLPLQIEDTNKPPTPPNSKTRRDLGLRVAWLIENGILPLALKKLATCIREDGNDGAHAGNLSKEDAEDLCDFTAMLLERLITEQKRLELAEGRRIERRSQQKTPQEKSPN